MAPIAARAACALCLGLGLGCTGEPAAPRLPPDAPIVLIVVDTLRADHVGTYGYARATTPHLDAWAAEGRVYERAIAPSSWTLPSMASLLTGRRPSGHGAGSASEAERSQRGSVKLSSLRPLAPGVVTLAERFRAAGRATGAIVTNSFLALGFGTARGFDYYEHRNAFAKASRRAARGIELALEWVRSLGGRPYFLVVHLFDPHLGYDAPPPVRGRFTEPFAGGRYALPFLGDKGQFLGSAPLEERDRNFVRAAYDEEIAYVDGELERLRTGLAAHGRLDEALVLLTADHGEEFFEHGGFEHGHAMWQEVLHVPLVVWGPHVRPGREAAAVSLLDVAPTLLEATGLAPDADLPGESLWANLTREAPLAARPIEADGTLYGHPQRTLIHWPEKLIVIDGLGWELLYDLSDDPLEQSNLAAERPERVRALAAALRQRLEDAPRAGSGAPALDSETAESLRSLGYVE